LYLKTLIGIENSEAKGGKMKTRKGRLNTVEFINEETVRKIGVVQEEVRPHRLKVEAWALSQARLRGVNVPRILDYYRDSNGREVLVLVRIHGKPLLRRISQENTELMFKVGIQLALLNKTPLDCGWGWINPVSMTGISERWQSFLLLYVQTYHEPFIMESILEEAHLQKVYSAIDGINLDISKPCLVHRDIKPSNVILGNDGKVWIVDWENTILGDSLYDLAIFGVRYGHGALWKSLVSGCGFDVSSPKYALYEIIGLIGLIDFYREHQINYRGRQKQLCRFIQRLG